MSLQMFTVGSQKSPWLIDDWTRPINNTDNRFDADLENVSEPSDASCLYEPGHKCIVGWW